MDFSSLANVITMQQTVEPLSVRVLDAVNESPEALQAVVHRAIDSGERFEWHTILITLLLSGKRGAFKGVLDVLLSQAVKAKTDTLSFLVQHHTRIEDAPSLIGELVCFGQIAHTTEAKAVLKQAVARNLIDVVLAMVENGIDVSDVELHDVRSPAIMKALLDQGVDRTKLRNGMTAAQVIQNTMTDPGFTGAFAQPDHESLMTCLSLLSADS